MRDFIFLMHNDAPRPIDTDLWAPYFADLNRRQVFDGGSAIGPGEAFRKAGSAGALSANLGGYIRVQAESLEAAKALLAGNPVYESGGTVEIRELPRG
jgi:hypothetical protein